VGLGLRTPSCIIASISAVTLMGYREIVVAVGCVAWDIALHFDGWFPAVGYTADHGGQIAGGKNVVVVTASRTV
jgi:hypothetical protein